MPILTVNRIDLHGVVNVLWHIFLLQEVLGFYFCVTHTRGSNVG